MKEFNPKPFTPGARVSWSHVFPGGVVVLRSGVVWSDAPIINGAKTPVWVTPDELHPSDVFSAVLVTCGRKSGTWAGDRKWSDGEAFCDVSSDVSQALQFMVFAARHSPSWQARTALAGAAA